MTDREKVEKCCGKKFIYLNTENVKGKIIKEIQEFYGRFIILFTDSTFSLMQTDAYHSRSFDFMFPIFPDLCYQNTNDDYSLTEIGKLLEVDISKWKEIKNSEMVKYNKQTNQMEYTYYLELKRKFEP